MTSRKRKLFRNYQELTWQTVAFSLLVFGLIVFILMRPPTDPDMGWHLRNGGDILRFGAPAGDLYSYTMFGYPWIAHEWLTDIGMYLMSQHLSWLVISLIFAALTAAAYWVAVRVVPARLEIHWLTALIAAMVAMPIVGVRPQMLTLLGLALTLWLLFRWRERPQSGLIWWLVPLMLVWVNLHGGFAVGLVLVIVFGMIELTKHYWGKWRPVPPNFGPILSLKQLFQLAGTGFIALGITLINPYTWRIYDELQRTLLNSAVRKGISEWMPVIFNNPQSYNLIIYAALLIFLLIIVGWRRVDITKLVLGIVFFAIAITSWRNIPLFSLVTLPLLVEIMVILAPRAIHYHLTSWWLLLAVAGVAGYLGWIRYQLIAPFDYDKSRWESVGTYPYEAVQYIKSQQISGTLFNEYNWGGYLVWQLPEKRVFIDGRMAIWTTSDQNIFDDYMKVSRQDPTTLDILSHYDVGLALLYSNRSTKDYFLSQSKQWKLIYSDNTAMLFQRTDLLAS